MTMNTAERVAQLERENARLRGELAEMTEQYMHGIRLHANVSSMLITAETERDRLRTAATSIVEAWERSDGGGSGVEHIAAAIDAARKLVKP